MIVLRRTRYLKKGTRGVLVLPSGTYLHTIELPWRGNSSGTLRSGGSCIPEGRYPLTADPYLKGGYDSVLISDVRRRTQIQVHVANSAADVEGCIGVGDSTGKYAPDGYEEPLPAVWNSRDTYFEQFLPEVKPLLPTEIVVASGADVVEPAGMAELKTGSNLQEHFSELDV